MTRCVLVFDGDCDFCAGWVRFVTDRVAPERVDFVASRSAEGRRLLAVHGFDVSTPGSVVWIDGVHAHRESEAILRVARQMGWPWRGAAIARVLPRALRDRAYRSIAARRHRLSTRRGHCTLPSEERDPPRRDLR